MYVTNDPMKLSRKDNIYSTFILHELNSDYFLVVFTIVNFKNWLLRF